MTSVPRGAWSRPAGSSSRSRTAAARPAPATPSVTAHGGRGLNIITALADDWGVRDDIRGEVTVWVIVHDDVHDPDAGHRRDDFATRVIAPAVSQIAGLDFADAFDDMD